MKLRGRSCEVENADPSGPGGVPPANAGDTLRKAADLAKAADEAIRRALSGNSEQFLASNRQQGGQ
jgi:hypothetical protein